MNAQATSWWDVITIRGPEEIKYLLNVAGKQPATDVIACGLYVTVGVVSVWVAVRWLLKRWRGPSSP